MSQNHLITCPQQTTLFHLTQSSLISDHISSIKKNMDRLETRLPVHVDRSMLVCTVPSTTLGCLGAHTTCAGTWAHAAWGPLQELHTSQRTVEHSMAHLGIHAEAVIVLRGALQRIEVELSAAADEALQLLRLEQLEHLVLAPQLHLTTGQALRTAGS